MALLGLVVPLLSMIGGVPARPSEFALGAALLPHDKKRSGRGAVRGPPMLEPPHVRRCAMSRVTPAAGREG